MNDMSVMEIQSVASLVTNIVTQLICCAVNMATAESNSEQAI